MSRAAIQEVFSAAQHTSSCHQKYIKRLQEVYNASNHKAFLEQFLELLLLPLSIGEREPNVDRTLDFVAKFAVSHQEKKNSDVVESSDDSDDDLHPFLADVLDFLLQHHNVNQHSFRFRICQLVNKILSNMSDDVTIDDNLFSMIYDSMIQRLQDKAPGVRVQAVIALQRLQDPRNRDCGVIKAYLYHLEKDPNPDVRRAILMCIGAARRTVGGILDRTRDARDTVRRQAYLFIANKIPIRLFTISQREQLLKQGLGERSEPVKRAVEKNLLDAWLKALNNSVVELLHALDVEQSTDTAILMLNTIFKNTRMNELTTELKTYLSEESNVIELKKLSPETALLWRMLAHFLQQEGGDEQLEEIIPELTHFCNYIRRFLEEDASSLSTNSLDEPMDEMRREFVLRQLILMTDVFDLADEAGRRSLGDLIRHMLMMENVGLPLVKPLVERLEVLVLTTDARVDQLVEIISEIREPLTKMDVDLTPSELRKVEVQATRVRVKLNSLREDLEEAVKEEQFNIAQELKNEIAQLEAQLVQMNSNRVQQEEVREEVRTPQALSKCLSIVCEMLHSPQVKSLSATLRSLLDNFVLTCIQEVDSTVRALAIQALGMFCTLSKDLAKQHFMLIRTVLDVDQPSVQVVALKAIFDLLLLYGLSLFHSKPEPEEVKKESKTDDEIEEENEEEANRTGVNKELNLAVYEELMSCLARMLDTNVDDIRSTAVEGFCKLLLSSSVNSPVLFSRLVLIWFNPMTVRKKDDDGLRQVLGLFFSLYASQKRENQEVIAQAYLPTLRTLLGAPHTSPLADVEVDSVIRFLVQLTRPDLVDSKIQGTSVHVTLALLMCSTILSDPHSLECRTYARGLPLLTLTPEDTQGLKEAYVLAQKVLKKVKEKATQRHVTKFIQNIKGIVGEDVLTAEIPPNEDLNSSSDTTAMLSANQSRRRLFDSKSNRMSRMSFAVERDDEMVTFVLSSGLDHDKETTESSPNIEEATSPSSSEARQNLRRSPARASSRQSPTEVASRTSTQPPESSGDDTLEADKRDGRDEALEADELDTEDDTLEADKRDSRDDIVEADKRDSDVVIPPSPPRRRSARAASQRKRRKN